MTAIGSGLMNAWGDRLGWMLVPLPLAILMEMTSQILL